MPVLSVRISSGLLSLKRGLQSATGRVYGHFELFLFHFLPFRERASVPKPSLESSHKKPTGSFATSLARRSCAHHFHTRGRHFHAGFTSPRARTSTTTTTPPRHPHPPPSRSSSTRLRRWPPSRATRTPSTAKPQPAAPRGGGRVNAESGDSVAAVRKVATATRGSWGWGGSAASAGGGVGLETWNEGTESVFRRFR